MPAADPDNALFVDFEATKRPLEPAILGVLKVERGAATFEQVIVDPQLKGAAAARRSVRYSDIEPILITLLDTGLPVIGWSLFDRNLVDSLPVAESVKRAWTGRYVNALPDGKRWRRKVHPTFEVKEPKDFDPKHTLDQYARFAGYPHVDKLEGAQPAEWVRRVRTQLGAKRLNRRSASEGRRYWRRLLEYNKHDCYALRHVYAKASFELDKWEQYEATTYCVEDGPRTICFRVGSTNRKLDDLLERYAAERWAFLTAWNPESRRLSRAENDRRQSELIELLAESGYRCLRGEGRGQDASWPPEESVLALDIPRRAARAFGRRFGQLAVVVGHRGFPSRLVACA